MSSASLEASQVFDKGRYWNFDEWNAHADSTTESMLAEYAEYERNKAQIADDLRKQVYGDQPPTVLQKEKKCGIVAAKQVVASPQAAELDARPAPAEIVPATPSRFTAEVVQVIIDKTYFDEHATDDEVEWRLKAPCAQADPEVFFPKKGGSTKEAKRICNGCDVKDQCLEEALANGEPFGVWGGMSARERNRLKREIA